MKLSAFTDYSLRLLMYLAADPGRRSTIAEVAAFDIPENHLTKVAHGLGRAGWLANTRGKGGGLALALGPEHIVIGEVVRHTERADVPAACFAAEARACPVARGCRLQGVLGEAVDAFYAVLDRSTLADLVRQPQALIQLRGLAPRSLAA